MMSKITRTIKVSSENCQKLVKLGTLEDSFNSLIERLLGIYYDREKEKTTATGNRRSGTQESLTTQRVMNSVVEGKRVIDDSKTISDDVIISYFLPRCHTNSCLKCSRHYVSEVCKN